MSKISITNWKHSTLLLRHRTVDHVNFPLVVAWTSHDLLQVESRDLFQLVIQDADAYL